MATLDDWLKEIEGKSELDSEDFADLLPRDADDPFFQKAFATLPSGNFFISKIRDLLNDNDASGMYVLPKAGNSLSETALLKLCDEYSRDVSRYMGHIGRPDLASHADKEKLHIARTNDEFYKIITSGEYNYSEIQDEIGIKWVDSLDDTGEYMYSLDEAVNRLTTYPAITRYLLEDVTSFPLKGRSYYELWKGGGDIYFYADFRVILCPGK